jgi:hypothetical protein
VNTNPCGFFTLLLTSVPIIGVTVVAGCSERDVPTGQEAALNHSSVQVAVDYPEEHPLRDLALRIPGHGGFFFDTASGNLVVYLKNLGDADAAKSLLRSMLARELSDVRVRHSQADVVARQGTYTFLQLREWRDRLTLPILETRGVAWLDLDEVRNRVVVGLDAGADPVAAREVVSSLRIPNEAVEFESSPPFVLFTTLTDRVRPLVGGLRITSQSLKACTLGFNAIWSGMRAFVTASHCSDARMSPDSTAQFQANRAPGDTIGYEVADYSEVCGSRKCSLADAAVYGISDSTVGGSDWVLGRIARTRLGCFGNCYPPFPEILEIDPDRPHFYIESTQG